MMTLTDFFELPFGSVDPAAAAMWGVHPEGPPPDVYEPPFDYSKAHARAYAYQRVGMLKARESAPHLFDPVIGGRTR